MYLKGKKYTRKLQACKKKNGTVNFQITFPKKIVDYFQMEEGDFIEFEISNFDSITVRKLTSKEESLIKGKSAIQRVQQALPQSNEFVTYSRRERVELEEEY